MTGGIDWPNLVVGFALGLTVPASKGAALAVRHYRDPTRSKYRGQLWLYYWSLDQREVVEERTLTGRFSWLRLRLRHRMSADSLGLAYSGEFVQGHGTTRYLLLRGEGNRERVAMVLKDQLGPQFTVAKGVMASVDRKGRPVALRFLLSRNALTPADAERLLGTKLIMRTLER